MSALGLLLFLSSAQIPNELNRYVLAPDATTYWKVTKSNSRFPASLSLQSQTWQGIPWKHSVEVSLPKVLRRKGTAVLYITGGVPNKLDRAEAQQIADKAGVPVSMLYDIPNQPIWDQKEDALIALSFQKWFETKDASWPLLYPMAKSAYEAMNALQQASRKSRNPIQKFVVTGASKRGWTAWLTAATGDKRIVGLAPMVFDNLRIMDQMRHQKELWGHYSPEIEDYAKTGMIQALETPDGQRLCAMVDPFSYLERIRCPVFMIHGANDPFWTVDALNLYWDQLKMPRSCLIVPNAGHTLGDKKLMVSSLAAFAAACSGEFKWPTSYRGKVFETNGQVQLRYSHLQKNTMPKLFAATSRDSLFVDSEWIEVPLGPSSIQAGASPQQTGTARVHLPINHPTAFVSLGEHVVGRHRFWLSEPATILKPDSLGTLFQKSLNSK